MREKGFNGSLTIIGDEPHEPYDRPPLSKQVLKGWVPADHTKLPRLRRVDADWKLGVAAVGLDRINHVVKLANGEDVEYDRLLIATGTRARPWPNPEEGALQGVFTVRTVEDAAALAAALKARPKRVLIVGSGFVGSEIASVCRDLDLPVTVAERGKGPLMGALGGVISEIAAGMMRDAGVDLRTGVAVEASRGRRPVTSGGPGSRTGPSSTSTWWWPRWARSAMWSGSTAPAWPPGSGGWPATPAAGPSTSTAW